MIEQITNTQVVDEFFGAHPVVSASIKVTRRCNLACRHCYVRTDFTKAYTNELTSEEICAVILQLSELGCMRLFINGGEPFLFRGLPQVVAKARELGLEVFTSSNGAWFTGRASEELARMRFTLLQVSIDGDEATHDFIRGVSGSFRKAVEFFHYARDNFRYEHLVVATTVMRHNVAILPRMLEIVADLCPTTYCVVPIMPSGKASKSDDITGEEKKALFDHLIQEWEHSYRKNFKLSLIVPPGLIPASFRETTFGRGYLCSFPYMLGVDSNGDVAPCDGLLSDSQYVLGNVRNRKLGLIVANPLYKQISDVMPQQLGGVCARCKFLMTCRGGCRVDAKNQFDSFLAPDPLCQEFFEAGLFPAESLAA